MIRCRTGELNCTDPMPESRRTGIGKYLVSAAVGAILFPLIGTAHACPAPNGQTGVASYYGPGLEGKRTASGERYDMMGLTAAHPCLPLGTRIKVTVLGTGRSVEVRVNDRSPSRRRVLDLSVGAARALGIAHQGVARVVITPPTGGPT